ncbi:MAG: dynamin family protein [Betaproteobacteria bacterium]|nr:dynamin family protein [Betaproteobacteria bacterium]
MRHKPAITERLAELQSWRHNLHQQIVRVADFLRLNDFATADIEALMQEQWIQVSAERVTIALVAEVARGKSELINALFFPDFGRRLMPSGLGHTTRCVTELSFNRDQPTGIKLLPIETRESPRRFEELLQDESLWHSIRFDADQRDSVAHALGALSETIRVSVTDAVAWGLHRRSASGALADATQIDVPRWRYAIINLPHPLLDAGLVILDTPGLNALTAEPEIARKRIPEADAVLLVLDVNEGVTDPDLVIWRDYLGGQRPARERDLYPSDQALLAVLNKIDDLPIVKNEQGQEDSRATLQALDTRVRETAERLGVDPIRVIPISAKLSLLGSWTQDPDKTIRSRLYQLERSLAANLPRNRQQELTKTVLATLMSALDTAQSMLDQQRFDTLAGLQALNQLREKNDQLITTLIDQGTSKQARLDAAVKELKGLRAIHARTQEELSTLIDVEAAKRDAEKARQTIASSILPGKTIETVQQYFRVSAEKLDAAEIKIAEIRSLLDNIGEKMHREFGKGYFDLQPFVTQRFRSEMQKVQAKADSEFTKSSNLLTHRSQTLADTFKADIANRIIHIFEIASREAATWMRGMLSELEKPLNLASQQMRERAAKLERMRTAQLDLAERIAELSAQMDVIKRKHDALLASREGLARMSGEPPQ